ncbi:MAG: Fe/S biogenesis protein NfuA [Acidimicrobiales bacterium]|nr:MAG: Fe/S biogenesis protein NfuA [Acidimicrobiales bacterium]
MADSRVAEGERVLEITDAALERILQIRSEEDEPDELVLRIEVTGHRGVDYTYDLAFVTADDLQGDEVRWKAGSLEVAVPPDSVDKLRGAVLDLPANPMQNGLVLRNPNRPNPLEGVADLHLEGDLADKVRQLLEQSVNPALAMHGGFAELVGVDEDGRVFVTMGGGCQGCALSQATLVDGITRAIKEAIPEVTEVVDVTDHASGSNPYF